MCVQRDSFIRVYRNGRFGEEFHVRKTNLKSLLIDACKHYQYREHKHVLNIEFKPYKSKLVKSKRLGITFYQIKSNMERSIINKGNKITCTKVNEG